MAAMAAPAAVAAVSERRPEPQSALQRQRQVLGPPNHPSHSTILTPNWVMGHTDGQNPAPFGNGKKRNTVNTGITTG